MPSEVHVLKASVPRVGVGHFKICSIVGGCQVIGMVPLKGIMATWSLHLSLFSFLVMEFLHQVLPVRIFCLQTGPKAAWWNNWLKPSKLWFKTNPFSFAVDYLCICYRHRKPKDIVSLQKKNFLWSEFTVLFPSSTLCMIRFRKKKIAAYRLKPWFFSWVFFSHVSSLSFRLLHRLCRKASFISIAECFKKPAKCSDCLYVSIKL